MFSKKEIMLHRPALATVNTVPSPKPSIVYRNSELEAVPALNRMTAALKHLTIEHRRFGSPLPDMQRQAHERFTPRGEVSHRTSCGRW